MRDDTKLLHLRLFQMPSCTSWFTKNMQGYRLYSRLLQGGFREACTRVCFVRAIPYTVLRATAAVWSLLAAGGLYSESCFRSTAICRRLASLSGALFHASHLVLFYTGQWPGLPGGNCLFFNHFFKYKTEMKYSLIAILLFSFHRLAGAGKGNGKG